METSHTSEPGAVQLLGTVFVCGAAVMTIEIVGTRIIGPVFGVGLYVWASLLAVTLASLASGYYAGGVVADRVPNGSLLQRLVVASGVLLALAPLLSRSTLSLGESLGIRLGPLFSASVLFASPLVVLGMTAPVSVRLHSKKREIAGRGVGTISAASTFGSLVGTLFVAFVAIPAFDARLILGGTSAILIFVGCVLSFRRRTVGLLALPLIIGDGSRPPLPDGIRIVAQTQSLLGLVQVISDDNRGVRFLRSDHSVIGAAFEQDGTSAFEFVNVVAAAALLRPGAKTCLTIGLGTGAVPMLLSREGLRVDTVEIDAAVVRLAQQHFGYKPSGHVEVEDARAYLQTTARRYDIVVHDTFTGGATPEHLLSSEVLGRIKRILNPGGVLALNFVGYYAGEEAEASYAVARTLRSQFPNVNAYRDSAPAPSKPVGNIIFFASDRPMHFPAPLVGVAADSGAALTPPPAEWQVLASVPAGPTITDATNPLARLQIPIAEKHFAAMNELLPRDVWLN